MITHLTLLKREGTVNIWHDNEILLGDKWRDAIFNNFTDSDLLLYLTSAQVYYDRQTMLLLLKDWKKLELI